MQHGLQERSRFGRDPGCRRALASTRRSRERQRLAKGRATSGGGASAAGRVDETGDRRPASREAQRSAHALDACIAAGLRARGRASSTHLRVGFPGDKVPSASIDPSFPHTAAGQRRIRTGFPINTTGQGGDQRRTQDIGVGSDAQARCGRIHRSHAECAPAPLHCERCARIRPDRASRGARLARKCPKTDTFARSDLQHLEPAKDFFLARALLFARADSRGTRFQ